MAITILLVYYCKIHLGLKISRAYHLQALFGITSTLLYLAAQMSWDSVGLAGFATAVLVVLLCPAFRSRPGPVPVVLLISDF